MHRKKLIHTNNKKKVVKDFMEDALGKNQKEVNKNMENTSA